MPSPRGLAGSLLQYDTPNWEPLEQLVGLDLCEWFMWMHAVRLEDGREIHAYKHIATRCYLHLAVDGAAFFYMAGEYVPVGLVRAIGDAFKDWEKLRPQPESLDRVRLSLIEAIRRASERQIPTVTDL
jgi:hypothetical protein